MSPGSAKAVSSKYLAELSVRLEESGSPTPDEALLSSLPPGVRITWIRHTPIGTGEEKPAERTPYAMEPGQTLEAEQGLTTMAVIATDDLPGWVRSTVPSLIRLSKLEDNWDSYGSPSPSAELVRSLLRRLKYTEIESVPDPQVVPASGGGIQLEWYMGSRELEVEFRADGSVEFLATNKEKQEEIERPLHDLDDLRFWLMWVVGRD